jgi:hypothetical protein
MGQLLQTTIPLHLLPAMKTVRFPLGFAREIQKTMPGIPGKERDGFWLVSESESGQLLTPDTTAIYHQWRETATESAEIRASDENGEFPEPMRGLGDLVAKVAQPIAGAIDAVFGTSIKGCGGCAERQETLNKAIPFR